MELAEKQLVKIADIIRDKLKLLQVHRYREIQRLTYNVSSNLEHLQMFKQAMDKCTCFIWNRAANKLTVRAQRIIRDLPYAIAELERGIKASETQIPSLKQLYEELKQI